MAIYVGSYDWGPCIDKIVINTAKDQNPESVKTSDFIVERVLYQKDTGLGMSKSTIRITDAFTSDSKGNKTDEASKYITILTDVYPTIDNLSPFPSYVSSGIFDKFYNYRITNDSLNLKITRLQGFVNETVSKFTKDNFEFETQTDTRYYSINLPYMFYVPDNASEKAKIPLILWFHGLGESGLNPYLVLLGAEAANLADDKIQNYFKNGAAVLAPQCPTGWLETTESSVMGIRYWAPIDIDGTVEKVANPIKKFLNNFIPIEEPEEQAFAAVSYYTEPVTELLMNFLESHPEIDRNRIYVGGCSAGGYMTMNMLFEHPELFAAAFPICEYYLDSKISNNQIKALAEKPIWFTYAKNDGSVNPKSNSMATIKRLKEANAKNLKVSEFEKVIDTSGTVPLKRNATEDDDKFGLPYEYNGHFSWIYVLNDECRDGDLSLFDWLSQQSLK